MKTIKSNWPHEVKVTVTVAIGPKHIKFSFHNTREVFEHDGVTSSTGDLRTFFEIRNAKEANEPFLLTFRDKRPLDDALIREFQLQLTHGTYDPPPAAWGTPRRIQVPRLCNRSG